MDKFWRSFWFGFILFFALLKDVMDIIGNLLIAVGGTVLSVIFDVICIIMIVLLTLLQRGELKNFLNFRRKNIIKLFGWLLELIPIGTDFLPLTAIVVTYDHLVYCGKIKREQIEQKNIGDQQKEIMLEQKSENLKKEQNKKENETENIKN